MGVASARRAAIDRHFASRQRERPALWNGRVLLVHRYAIGGGVLRGACFETDYASFLAWRDWGLPDPGVFNVFAAAALRAASRRLLSSARWRPPRRQPGSLFPLRDAGPRGHYRRRHARSCRQPRPRAFEETGIDIATLDVAPGWCLVRDRGYVALMKRLTARQSADELRSAIMRHLASGPQPELSDVRIVHGRAEFDPRMPAFIVAFLEQAWRQ